MSYCAEGHHGRCHAPLAGLDMSGAAGSSRAQALALLAGFLSLCMSGCSQHAIMDAEFAPLAVHSQPTHAWLPLLQDLLPPKERGLPCRA